VAVVFIHEGIGPAVVSAGDAGQLALISLSSLFGYFLTVVWAWVVFPYGAAYLRTHSRTLGWRRDKDAFDEVDTQYWRSSVL
jgi:hypothetical protein